MKTKHLFFTLIILCSFCLNPPNMAFSQQAGVKESQSTPTNPVYLKAHPLSTIEAVELIKDSLQKANFFNILDFNENGKIYVEGYYAKIDLKDPTRYLGTQDQSKLYSVRVNITQPLSAKSGVTFRVSAKNESTIGKKYADTVKTKFEDEFLKRLAGFDKFREANQAEIAAQFLKGENLVGLYGYTTLKQVGLTFEEPGSWENQRKSLLFLSKACPETSACQAIASSITNQEAFWTQLKVEAKKDASVLEEVGFWIKPEHDQYNQYLSLLNDSTNYIDGPIANLSLTEYENPKLPEEWKAKGVGSEKARAIEKAVAFRSYDYLKRNNAFDVDTEEVLRVRRIAQKVFPYALRKGLDYKVHIYDDTKPGSGALKNNAFTTGGGVLYFSRSLIQRLDPQDEAAIAAVVAHELGHNEAYHMQRRIMRAEVANVIIQLSQIGDLVVPGVSDVTALTSHLILKSYSRSDESEADRLGLYILYKAGYEPQAMERVMDTLYKMSGSRYTSLLDSHPAPPARKKRITYLITNREILEKTTQANADEELVSD